MIKIQGKLPRKFILACSGGVDSMSALDFLWRNHEVIALYVNHGTVQSKAMQDCVVNYCQKNNLNVIVKTIENKVLPKKRSQEEHWRDERYRIIDTISEEYKLPVVTCHHLDDCIETWVWSAMHGTPKIIPWNRRNTVVRPFRLTTKSVFRKWAERHKVPYVEDSSNSEMRYTRNYIRHVCIPHVKHINPGIEKMIAKKVLKSGPLPEAYSNEK